MDQQPDSTAAESAAPGSAATPRLTDQSPAITRPFRVKLRGSVLVLVRLPNRRCLRAKFQQLSITGGVINIAKPLEEKLEVELIFHVGQATIRNKAQMLFPMWATQGWMQPFRFVNLPDADREALDTNLKSYLGETALGETATAASVGA
ncbi:MAG TPA: hypothetical protein VEH47_08735 [Candidatus Acidoferrales bacterium]|nr:hypothetical protein [Candidatus Acidoferrales bacterium]